MPTMVMMGQMGALASLKPVVWTTITPGPTAMATPNTVAIGSQTERVNRQGYVQSQNSMLPMAFDGSW